MEIKKGISQMAEYPNVEINYVVPADGKMYYVLKNGELKNGCVIATLDPKKAIDDSIYCDNIGVFAEDGSVLIDFNKKEIRSIADEFVLAVNAIPTSDDVVNALKNESDEISKAMLKNSSTTIVDKMMIEMGITGELLFSDSYSEANIYKLDSSNHRIGLDSSFIGKSDLNFYFHSNDVSSETVVFDFDGNEKKHESNEPEPAFNPTNIPTSIDVSNNNEQTVSIDDMNSDDSSLKLDISQNILDGFKSIDDSVINKERQESSSDNENDIEQKGDRVLDSAIETMKKMIDETNKLNEKIAELEKELANKTNELEEKNRIINDQESKKNELSSLLDEANEVLDSID